MDEPLDLGCFSVSLDVDDLDASVSFYEALGFRVLGGGEGYKILGNGSTRIGLFAIELGTNILTFNPGLDQEWAGDGPDGASPGPGLPTPADGFTDVREIERRLRDRGIELERPTETESGPDHLLLRDPDGNLIMIDQFF